VSEPRNDSVAARLRTLRSNLGLSQEQLARRLGVSFATVNRWESGRTRLSDRALAALAELEASAAARAADVDTTSALPVARSAFVGRHDELADLARLIAQSRLVSLTGPGGAGKTRLAIEVLQRDFADADVVFVPLDRMVNPRALLTALAFRLHVADQPGIPLIESVRAALRQAPRLLLLDGAERMAAQVAELTGDLLGTVPGLRVVVTSRVVLGVPGEVCWTVPPLACPSVAAGVSDIVASDAVRLFVTRASERVPGFSTTDVPPHAIAELCRRLDGLPLAIELIASWVGTLSVPEILQQRAMLLDYGSGQPDGRRLADVLQVSYELLGAEQQRRLAMLSVFAGSFGVGDIQSVLGLESAAAAAATARQLVDSSWLVVTRDSQQNTFSMLESIRTFAAHRQEHEGDLAAAGGRHARHFAALAADSELGLVGPDAAGWRRRLETSVVDLYAALTWADEHNEVDLGLDMSATLWQWWLASGRLAHGRAWVANFLERAGRRQDERTARALCSAAVLAAENADYAAAVEYSEQALAIFGPLGLTTRMALAATVLGSAQRYLGNRQGGRQAFQLALDLRSELGDPRGMSVAMNNIALVELDDGNLERARELFERSLDIKRDLGEQRSISIGLVNLADVLIRMQEWDAADQALAEAADQTAGDPQLTGTIQTNQGTVAAHRREFAAAAQHFRAAIAAAQAGGHAHGGVEAMIGLGRVHEQTGEHAEAVRQLQAAEELAAKIGNPQVIAEAAAALAEITGPGGEGPGELDPAGPLPGNLTARQAQVLRLVATGLTNKQIAAELYLSPATVERHLATIYRNLGLTGRVEAARFALENGIAAGPTRPVR
jgi:predicted ATPase/DNA-binding CsgD family transcriptional regulator/DNA-binding transcriptional regulator YdaS (Cro superfamily)